MLIVCHNFYKEEQQKYIAIQKVGDILNIYICSYLQNNTPRSITGVTNRIVTQLVE